VWEVLDMTMKIRITNEDLARTATVEDEQFVVGKPVPDRTDHVVIGPGESREFYIHAARRLTITEQP
jgi:hypothetical protein